MRADKITRKKISTNLPLERKEKQEFPRGTKGIMFCSRCGIAYYKKSWHHALEEYKSLPEDAPVKFVLCPACQMIQNKQFEGEVKIKNIPEKEADGVARLVEGYGSRAYERDPLHRVIDIKKNKGERGTDLLVTTTENQLANKLANKIKDAFNKVRITRSFSSGPSDVAYITVEFVG